jgi:hypothetical protein
MSQDIQQYRQPEATPVGHAGTSVVIQDRAGWAISFRPPGQSAALIEQGQG